jgi:hypothetical protein
MSSRAQRSSRDTGLRAIAGTVALGLGAACAISGGGAVKVPLPLAPAVSLGDKIGGRLECLEDRCTDWYQLPVESDTEVSIRVDARSNSNRADFGLALSDDGMSILQHDGKPMGRPRTIRIKLDPGVYYISVYGIDNPTDSVSYVLSASAIRPRAAKRQPKAEPRREDVQTSPKPEPTRQTATQRPAPISLTAAGVPEVKTTSNTLVATKVEATDAPAPSPAILLTSAVLDTEFRGGVAIAVLLDAGESKGVVEGQRGRLVNHGEVIGEFQIIDVYAAGSRGLIDGEPSADISYDTSAEILEDPSP